jgi:hypothetical protein
MLYICEAHMCSPRPKPIPDTCSQFHRSCMYTTTTYTRCPHVRDTFLDHAYEHTPYPSPNATLNTAFAWKRGCCRLTRRIVRTPPSLSSLFPSPFSRARLLPPSLGTTTSIKVYYYHYDYRYCTTLLINFSVFPASWGSRKSLCPPQRRSDRYNDVCNVLYSTYLPYYPVLYLPS